MISWWLVTCAIFFWWLATVVGTHEFTLLTILEHDNEAQKMAAHENGRTRRFAAEKRHSCGHWLATNKISWRLSTHMIFMAATHVIFTEAGNRYDLMAVGDAYDFQGGWQRICVSWRSATLIRFTPLAAAASMTRMMFSWWLATHMIFRGGWRRI